MLVFLQARGKHTLADMVVFCFAGESGSGAVSHREIFGVIVLDQCELGNREGNKLAFPHGNLFEGAAF